ncbi:MAG TPA: limonene-1,2-epoxide hydrolase [Actinobacteria bacterium]|jgi:limonene-1,2-epoxide hydrolase|nr:limonene-1,2-epoxide hydrolase [Actinomycetota bacterium]
MSGATAGDIVTALVQACERRDLDAVCALVTDDIEYDNVPIGKVHGPEGVRSVLSGGVTQAATEVEWVVHRQIESGDIVMNERTDRFLVDGRWVEIPIAAVFVVRDGKVALWRDYFDLETYRRQRG